MSEQVQKTSQQTLAIGLGAIAVLLVVIIGMVIYFQSQATSIPNPTGEAQTGTGAASGEVTTPAGMGQATAAAFDPKSATKVPKGTEPEAFVKAYYEACDKGDWEAAFELLPTVKKAGNSPEALKEQVSGYGIKNYKITSAKVEGDKATVLVDQETGQYGTFENTWTFVKEGGVWLVESKAVTGMK